MLGPDLDSQSPTCKENLHFGRRRPLSWSDSRESDNLMGGSLNESSRNAFLTPLRQPRNFRGETVVPGPQDGCGRLCRKVPESSVRFWPFFADFGRFFVEAFDEPLEFADVLLLNKCDLLVSEAQLGQVEDFLRRSNPAAEGVPLEAALARDRDRKATDIQATYRAKRAREAYRQKPRFARRHHPPLASWALICEWALICKWTLICKWALFVSGR